MSFPSLSSQMYETGGQLSIDLHGSSVREAKVSLQETFETAKEKGLSGITVITGVGKHSKNNYSLLFNRTVPEFLEQPEIKAQISQVKRDRGGELMKLSLKIRINQKKPRNSKKYLLP
jgi:DNA-nicking Smr family endonuclease